MKALLLLSIAEMTDLAKKKDCADILLDYSENVSWLSIKLKQLKERAALVITSTTGQPALLMQVGYAKDPGDGKTKPYYAYWNFITSAMLYEKTWAPFGTPGMVPLEELTQNILDGKEMCVKCTAWHKASKLKPFGFAGRVCNKCYRPALHQGADTASRKA